VHAQRAVSATCGDLAGEVFAAHAALVDPQDRKRYLPALPEVADKNTKEFLTAFGMTKETPPTRTIGAWGTLVSFQPTEFQQWYRPAVGCRKEKRTKAWATRPSLLQRRAPRH
jgi:hypothetical protein